MKGLKLLVLVGLLFCIQPVIAGVVSDEWAQKWQSDLGFVKQKLPETHPNVFHAVSEDEFHGQIEALSTRVPELSHHQIIVELSAIVASIGDGHTRLTLPMVEGSNFFAGHSETLPPSDPAMLFNHLPIRMYIYSDGLYVRSIGAENAAYAGARVIQIGRLPTAEALDSVSRVVHRDNEYQLKNLAPSRLVMPEVLWALGISGSKEQVTFVLETIDGNQHQVTMHPVGENQSVEWVNAAGKSAQEPLYQKNNDANFWFEEIEGQKTVYWQFNEVYDTVKESVANFAVRLTNYLTEHRVGKLILDLRFNMGGNNSLNRSLLHALIRAPELQEPGSLYVITGRGTFSAAMMFALDLEEQTNAIFVGEPTGASPNHYGDSRKVRLPDSGITIRVSTLYWQSGGPRDKRQALKPHIPAELSSKDYREGNDPALAAILALSKPDESGAVISGSWASWVLGYNTIAHVDALVDGLAAKIDFVDMDANGLALQEVKFKAPVLSFDFPNGDEVIRFEGKLHGDTIIGKATMQDQVYPWVALRHP